MAIPTYKRINWDETADQLRKLSDWKPTIDEAIKTLPKDWKKLAVICKTDPDYYPPLILQRCHAFGEWSYRYVLDEDGSALFLV